jgi:hypothetical protein
MRRSAATIGNYSRHGWEEIAAKSSKRRASEHRQQAQLVITRPCIIIKPTVIMILASTKWGMSTLTRVKMHAEGLGPAKHRKADAAGGHRAGVHALDVIGARDVLSDVPATLDHPLVGGNVVPHEPHDHHHDMLGDADRIAVGDLGDRNPTIDRSLKVCVGDR